MSANICVWNLKRGQMEMFGLAVIVVLISLGFFIYISYKAQYPMTSSTQSFTSDKLASDFVLSILPVNIADCSQFTLKDLVIDCASHSGRIDCNGIDSCTELNKTVIILLNETFMARHMAFRFYSQGILTSTGSELFNLSYLNCTSLSDQGRAGIATLSLYPDPNTAFLMMNICST